MLDWIYSEFQTRFRDNDNQTFFYSLFTARWLLFLPPGSALQTLHFAHTAHLLFSRHLLGPVHATSSSFLKTNLHFILTSTSRLSSISFPSCPIHALGTVSFQSTAGQAFFSISEEECLVFSVIPGVDVPIQTR